MNAGFELLEAGRCCRDGLSCVGGAEQAWAISRLEGVTNLALCVY